jgi:hypothetical protein
VPLFEWRKAQILALYALPRTLGDGTIAYSCQSSG